jgi:hypothetical protein
MKDKINELPTRELCREIYEFKKAYQIISDLLTNENGDMLADSNNILIRRENTFCSYLTCITFVLYCREKYIQLKH